MSTHYLIFVISLIPRYRMNSYHFWMPIQAIIKSASPLMMKKNNIHHTIQDFLLHQDGLRAKEWGAHTRSVYT
jgi:hypothetical protein